MGTKYTTQQVKDVASQLAPPRLSKILKNLRDSNTCFKEAIATLRHANFYVRIVDMKTETFMVSLDSVKDGFDSLNSMCEIAKFSFDGRTIDRDILYDIIELAGKLSAEYKGPLFQIVQWRKLNPADYVPVNQR